MEEKNSNGSLTDHLNGILSNNSIQSNEISTEDDGIEVTTNLISQQNNVVSIPSTLQDAINLQNEQLGIDIQSNNTQLPNSNTKKRRISSASSISSSVSSNSSLSSLGSVRARLIPKTGIENNDNVISHSMSQQLQQLHSNDNSNNADNRYNSPNVTESRWKTDRLEKELLTIDCDVTQTPDINRIFHKESGQFYTISKDSVPTFKISRNVFNSPIDFFNKVADIGQQYGCIKLTFIEDNKSVLNFDHFNFKCRKQHLTSGDNINKSIRNFYFDLYNFYLNSTSQDYDLEKLPSYDNEQINLFILYNKVQLEGSYYSVTEKKRWRDIEIELFGKDLSNDEMSLQDVYNDFLLEFETFHKENDTNQLPNGDNNSVVQNTGIFELHNIEPYYPRIKDIKIIKNLQTNSNQTLNENRNNLKIIPDATKQWQTWFPVYDRDRYEEISGYEYDMDHYFDLTQTISLQIFKKFKQQLPSNFTQEKKLNIDQFEKFYFDILSTKDTNIEIPTAFKLSSLNHKTSLTKRKITDDDVKVETNRWKISNVPLDIESGFKYLNLDKGNYTFSKYDVGMMCSVSGWSVADSFLPEVDYQHIGAPKIWYSIQSNDFDKFESYIKSLNVQNTTSSIEPTEITNDDEFQKSVLYESYNKQKTSKITDENRLKSYKDLTFKDSEKVQLPQNLQINPDTLRAQGIKVYRIIQESGSYIFKYPKSYTSTIGTDFYFSESANFIPKSIPISYIAEGSDWLASRYTLPGIHYSHLLLNMIRYSNDQILNGTIKNSALELVNSELKNRSQVLKHFPNLEVLKNRFDFISDYSLRSTGLSKILIKKGTWNMTLTLDEFLRNIDISEKNEWILFNIPMSSIQISMHVYYEDLFLSSLMENIDSQLNIFTINDPVMEMTLEEKAAILLVNDYDNQRVPLYIIENMLSDVTVYDDYYYILKGLIDTTYPLITQSKEIITTLSFILENSKPNLKDNEYDPLATLNEPPVTPILRRFYSLLNQLNHLPVTFPEMEYLKQMQVIYNEFKDSVKNSITSNNLKLMEKAYLQCFEIPLDHEYFELLVNNISRHRWLNIYYELFVSYDVSQALIAKSLDFLYEFFEYGITYCQKEDLPKLTKVKERLILCQEFLRRVQQMVDRMRAGKKIPILNINAMLKRAEKQRLPIPIHVKRTLIMVSDCVKDISSRKVELEPEILNTNELIDKLDGYIRTNSVQSLGYLNKFNGSSEDKRLTINEVTKGRKRTSAENMEGYKVFAKEMGRLLKTQKVHIILNAARQSLDLRRDRFGTKDASECYCFCREGDRGTMIECEMCKEWYHTDCIGGKGWRLPNDKNSIFICRICDVNSNTVMPQEKAINFGDLKRNIVDVLYLSVIPERQLLQDYFKLYEIALQFRNEMFEKLFKDGNINKKVPLKLIKFYLRKAEKSRVEFIDLVGPLKRYCHTRDLPEFNEFKEEGKRIITQD